MQKVQQQHQDIQDLEGGEINVVKIDMQPIQVEPVTEKKLVPEGSDTDKQNGVEKTADTLKESSSSADAAPKTYKQLLKETFVDDKYFWLMIATLLLVNIGVHMTTVGGRWFGFILASYSAIANDSIQTLGTFITSNKHVVWWKQWIWISSIFLGTVLYSWISFDGDISFERL